MINAAVAQPMEAINQYGGGSADPGADIRAMTDAAVQQPIDAVNNAMGAAEAGSTLPQTTGGDYEDQAKSLWADILANSDKGFQETLQGLSSQEALAGRRAAEMNSIMGGSVGGGNFQSGQAQVSLGAMGQRADATRQHYAQQSEMKMAYLDRLMQQARAHGQWDLARELAAESDRTMLTMQQMGIEADMTNSAADRAFLGGLEDPAAAGAGQTSSQNGAFDGGPVDWMQDYWAPYHDSNYQDTSKWWANPLAWPVAAGRAIFE